jgi:hypothetical protein
MPHEADAENHSIVKGVSVGNPTTRAAQREEL